MPEKWKKANVIEKISIIMVILTVLFISSTGLLNFFFNLDIFGYNTIYIQNFIIAFMLIFLGIYEWRNNRVFAFLFWFGAISVSLTAFCYSPISWWYEF